MRAFSLFAIVTLSLGSLAGAALAEPAAVKPNSAAMQAAKSLNRMSVGLYRSLRTNRSSSATALNASLKSTAQGAVTDQKLNVERAAFTNRNMTSNVARSANPQRLQSLTAENFGAMGLSPAAVPSTARMNKLH